MATVPDTIQTWQMLQPARRDKQTGEVSPGILEKKRSPCPTWLPARCLWKWPDAVCAIRTWAAFFDGVPTVQKPPLTLGHEISGTVVAGDPKWIGKEVLVPAVMPCRQCELCKTRRGNRCLNQKMPGNSLGIYGGIASHIPVPAIDLCEVKNRGDIPLAHLTVVADTATTPFQAPKRADLQVGDHVIVIGIGGVGQPDQYNSSTTEMVKGVIAGFDNTSVDRSVVVVVFTGTGPFAFCTGGSTREYSEFYSQRPDEYGQYMELFNRMVDSILACKKPVICRVNGMRVAGGQEIGMACDITLSSDLAIFGQAGPRHGSAPDGSSTDFPPWYLGMEDAM